jgi:hypothetical protein
MAERHEGQGVEVDVTIFWIPLGLRPISLKIQNHAGLQHLRS